LCCSVSVETTEVAGGAAQAAGAVFSTASGLDPFFLLPDCCCVPVPPVRWVPCAATAAPEVATYALAFAMLTLRRRSLAVGQFIPCSFAALRSFVTIMSRLVLSGEPSGNPPTEGLKSPPRSAVTGSMIGDVPTVTCTGNAETSLFPGGAPRPPCHASACSFHFGEPVAAYGPDNKKRCQSLVMCMSKQSG